MVAAQPVTPGTPQERALLTADDLVTGEAIALDIPAAGLGSRLLSGLIDVIVVVFALFVAMVVLATATSGSDDALVAVGSVVATAAGLLIVPATLETLTRGRSLGKLALGLQVVRDDGGAISFHHAFVRALLGVIEIYSTSGVVAIISALINRQGKRLGDLAAGTYVVRTRIPMQIAPPVPMPPHLAGWAAQADMAALPVGLALAVRRFLAGQVGSVSDPVRRHQMADMLAARVQEHVHPGPPPGTPPEHYLAAVLATRRDRDAARLAREAELRARLTTSRDASR